MEENTSDHWQIKHSMHLSSLHVIMHTKYKPQTQTDLCCCQLCAINLLLLCHRNKTCVLSTRSRQEVVYFCSVQWAAGQTAALARVCPYVSYEALQAAAVFPQSVGPEASSALLRCYATRAWPRLGSGGCLMERIHCRHTRCRWGSEGIEKHTVKKAHTLLSKWI